MNAHQGLLGLLNIRRFSFVLLAIFSPFVIETGYLFISRTSKRSNFGMQDHLFDLIAVVTGLVFIYYALPGKRILQVFTLPIFGVLLYYALLAYSLWFLGVVFDIWL